jgi:uncharacterized protein YlzI (FlbEa/FlbD family)
MTVLTGDVWIFVTAQESEAVFSERVVNTAHITSIVAQGKGALLRMVTAEKIVVKESYDSLIEMLVEEFHEKRIFVSRSREGGE